MATQSDRIVLRNVIGSYMSILKPKTQTSDDGKVKTVYSMQVVIPKDHPQLPELKAAIMAKAKASFPGVKPGQLKLGLRDADAEEISDERMHGMMFFNASANPDKHKPDVINRGGRQLTSEDEIYSGCLVNVSVRLFSYNVSGNRGIGYGLGNVQLVEQRDRWDGRKSAADDFGTDSEFEDKGPPAPAKSESSETGEVSEDEDFSWD